MQIAFTSESLLSPYNLSDVGIEGDQITVLKNKFEASIKRYSNLEQEYQNLSEKFKKLQDENKKYKQQIKELEAAPSQGQPKVNIILLVCMDIQTMLVLTACDYPSSLFQLIK